MSIKVMTLVYGTKLGSANLKAVLVKLADYANDEGGNIWPAIKTVADQTELSESTVRRCMQGALKRKLLIVVREGGRGTGNTTRYRLDLTKFTFENLGCQPDTLGVKSRVSNERNQGVTVTPNPSREPSNRKSNFVFEKKQTPIGSVRDTSEPFAAYQERMIREGKFKPTRAA